MPRLAVATTNRGKLREIAEMLKGLPFEIVTLADWPDVAAPEENGRTFAENARLKALYYAAHTGELTVAEDSGLEIDELGGAPGIESARFGGPDSTYAEKFDLIYSRLRANGPGDAAGSPARFVCALALVRDGRILFESRGVVEGRIECQRPGSPDKRLRVVADDHVRVRDSGERVKGVRIDRAPAFSALFTLWLSITAAVGLASSAICSRHLTYNA